MVEPSSRNLSNYSTPKLTIAQLLEGLVDVDDQVGGRAVSGIALHSGEVKPGGLFFALQGKRLDGRRYIEEARERGAIAVVTDAGADNAGADNAGVVKFSGESPGLPLIKVSNGREAVATVAKRYFGGVTNSALLIGVTGTNGKTSVSWILAELLAELGSPSAHIGTLGMRVVGLDNPGRSESPGLSRDYGITSPDVVQFHSFMFEAAQLGVRSCAAEVSSIGVEQRRSAGIEWDGGVFTNLTHDHLDYHETFESYAEAKLRFFLDDLGRSAKPQRTVVTNTDDPFGVEIERRLRQLHPGIRVISCSASGDPNGACFVKPSTVSCTPGGTAMVASVLGQELELQSQFVGDYNVGNVLTAVSFLVARGFDPERVQQALRNIPPVPGRLELVSLKSGSSRQPDNSQPDSGRLPAVYVDYAHTPDALERAISSLRRLTSGRLITVFGCGGDRDRTKRPMMGEIATRLSDFAVLTSDNPRSEVPDRIIGDIASGIPQSRTGWQAEADRGRAIELAIKEAGPGDTILVAGKGHESYQEIAGVKYPFADQEVCRQALLGIS